MSPEYLLAKLKTCLTKVPAGVNNGSYQKAISFKEWVAKANKAIKKGEKNPQVLLSLINTYEGF